MEGLGELVEMFKNCFPFSFLFFIPIFIIISPVSPVNAAHEFAIYRMQQFDRYDMKVGSKMSLINMEARPLDAKMVTRRCIIARLKEVTGARYQDLVDQKAGGLIVLLPQDLNSMADSLQQHLQLVEQELLGTEDSSVPVYFAWETPEILNIYQSVIAGSGDDAATAVEALFSSASANGFQMVQSGVAGKALTDFQISNIQGHLSGYGIEEQLPTIAIVTHYDAFGIAPSLSTGADSNGSGVIAILELARLFSKLYTNSRTHAKFNLVFLLSGAGKFNYLGSKKWIEDSLDNIESTLLSDIAYVLCLDSIGRDNMLHLHVSKPPKEDSSAYEFLQHLEKVIQTFYPDVGFKMVHKKINLADEILAWEHERYSMKRLPAFTLSHLDSHKALDRSTILDTRSRVDETVLVRNIRIVAETLARHVYNLTSQGNVQLFSDTLDVQGELVSAWLDHLTSTPRAAQLLPRDASLLTTLEETMARYLKDVKRSTVKTDKRDPEFLFYDGAEYKMNAFNVKPAVFDLFLAVAIGGYLTAIYFLVQNFHVLLALFIKITRPVKATKVN
ncbi:nicalin-like [Mya arenaria]|uniref:nicalin-like n=1 Tax=Mya arenaria TaxID=6604 RepID=UPI0022E82B60|nr:nicalin-like [Mya arenaria]